MMRVVFLDKARFTYEVVDKVTHLHIDDGLTDRKHYFVLYTEDGIKMYPCRHYSLHKIDT